MANIESGIPTRSLSDGADERLHSKLVGHATDATLAAVAQYQVLVDVNGELHTKANIRALTNADVVTVEQSDRSKLLTNASIQVAGSDNATGNPVFVTPGTGATFTVSATNLDIRDLTEASDSILIYGFDGSNNQKIATDSNGVLYVSTGTPGTKVHQTKKGSAVIRDATDTNTYTVPALSTLTLKAIHSSASGAAHVEIKIGTPSSEAQHTFRFLRGGGANDSYILAEPISVAAGDNVLVIMTNKDNQAQDLFSVIEGTYA